MGMIEDKNLDALCKEYGEHLSKALKKMREKAGYTQKDLADKIGISPNSIGNFEHNRTKVPAYIVKKYCDECDASADELLRTGKEFHMDYKAKAVAEELPDQSDEFLEALWSLLRANKNAL